MDHSTTTSIVVHSSASTQNSAARPSALTVRLVIGLDRGIYWIARHWLLAVNLVFCAHFISLLLAPALVAWGFAGLARPIYAINGLFCHQREERSFTILGEPMACCERCAAIYTAIMLAGLLFAFAGGRVRTPHFSEFALLAMPLVVDGVAQLFGLWESTTATRVMTGTIFGLVVCWLLLPYLATGFARIRSQLETLFTRLVAEGRARPLRGMHLSEIA